MQCLHRWQKVLNPELVKGPWSPEVRSAPTQTYHIFHKDHLQGNLVVTSTLWVMQEDEKIIELVTRLGAKRWSLIAKDLPGRIGKQCRERCKLPCTYRHSTLHNLHSRLA